MMNRTILTCAAALLLAAQAYAGDVTVSDAWARASVPGQQVGLVGMVITSQRDARIIAVTSPVSESAEIHTMTMDNGVMKMRQLEYLPLPAKKAVTLGPGGDHLMLIDLKQVLTAGGNAPLTVTVQFADQSTEKVNVTAQIQPLTAGQNRHQRQHQ